MDLEKLFDEEHWESRECTQSTELKFLSWIWICETITKTVTKSWRNEKVTLIKIATLEFLNSNVLCDVQNVYVFHYRKKEGFKAPILFTKIEGLTRCQPARKPNRLDKQSLFIRRTCKIFKYASNNASIKHKCRRGFIHPREAVAKVISKLRPLWDPRRP